jgi:cytochrome P450
MEVQRSANIISQNVLRTTSNDVFVGGHKIPKGVFCIAQISVLHYDPENFDEPTKFKPERFLDSNNQLIKSDALMPFSLGKRIWWELRTFL